MNKFKYVIETSEHYSFQYKAHIIHLISPCFPSFLSIASILLPPFHSFWSYFSVLPPWHIGHLPIWVGEVVIFWCNIFLPFHNVHRVLKARILEWFAIPSSSGANFIRTLHYDSSDLGGPTWHGPQLHQIMQATSQQSCDP